MTGRLVGRLVTDSALYGTSAAIAKALALLTVPYLTRALSPVGYGIADLATSTAALLTLFAMFAGDIPATRMFGLTDDPRAKRQVLSTYVLTTIVIGCGIAIILAPLSAVIADRLWALPEQTPLATLSLLLVPISATQAALVQTQRIRRRPVSFATLSLVDLLAQLGLAVAFVALGLGAAGVVLGFVIGSAVGLGAAGVAAWSSLQARPDFTLIPRLVGHGLQFLPHVTAFVVADWAMRAVVANTAGPGGVAALAIAVRFASVLSLLGAAFAMAWGPIGLVRDRSDATSKIFGQVLVAYGAVSAASALLLAAVGPELVSLIAGPGYDAAALILPGFALAYAIAGTEYVLVVAAGVSNRGSLVALAASIGAIVQIVLAVIILPAAVGVATIGFIALAGRIVSFSILLRAVGGFLTLQPRRWLLLGVACALLFAATQVTLAQGTTWALGRWIIAGMVAVGAIVVGIRWSRGVGPMTFQ